MNPTGDEPASSGLVPTDPVKEQAGVRKPGMSLWTLEGWVHLPGFVGSEEYLEDVASVLRTEGAWNVRRERGLVTFDAMTFSRGNAVVLMRHGAVGCGPQDPRITYHLEHTGVSFGLAALLIAAVAVPAGFFHPMVGVGIALVLLMGAYAYTIACIGVARDQMVALLEDCADFTAAKSRSLD